ncbi:GntR family transcriptional regulator [Stappia sp. 28M-7]|uniref:GntR family transcriptional regulator n=1 Tax=Stappia sp. 28M-7 TaxID=2762596 RepID=UPI00163BE9EB|nr:GntR family transcriptional regulator [Stappia sp. 28M-7]MBC2860938.1 GntR family transcriptional regulator [Stappia sp. 28M-7]
MDTKASNPARVRGASVRERVTNALRADIITGVFVPGQRLSEAELCSHLDASRTPVREALRQLEAERLVEVRPNRGPIVVKLGPEEAERIYDVRELIEPEVVRLFALAATGEQLEQMDEALVEFEQASSEGLNPAQLILATTTFYEVMFQGCTNDILADILRGLLARVNLLRSRSMSRPGRPKESLKEMRDILSCIRARDVPGAQQAAITHIRNARAQARAAMPAPTAP